MFQHELFLLCKTFTNSLQLIVLTQRRNRSCNKNEDHRMPSSRPKLIMPSSRRKLLLLLHGVYLCHRLGTPFSPSSSSLCTYTSRGTSSSTPSRPQSTPSSYNSLLIEAYRQHIKPCYRNRLSMLHISTIDVETPSNESDINPSPSTHHSDISTNQNNLFQWKDIVPLSLFTIFCLIIATLISTYEDFDVTHTRPNPSTLRVLSKGEHHFNFIGAATKGMGWGSADRGAVDTGDSDFFEEWYGNSATSLQWKPSYNEIMLQHRSERIPRWTREQTSSQSSSLSTTANTDDATIPTKEDLQQAVLQLYKSLDELDDLKLMAEDYR